MVMRGEEGVKDENRTLPRGWGLRTNTGEKAYMTFILLYFYYK